jgi:hypothetical protein
MENAMKRFLYAVCLLSLTSVRLRAAEPEASHPVLDTLQKSARMTREAIYIPPVSSGGLLMEVPAKPLRNGCRKAAQTSARAVAFPFITGYVAVSDTFTTLQTRWLNGE